MSEPRASTDEESAPLLDNERRRDQSFWSALTHPSRPLTNLEKLLVGGGVVLLLLMSTFIGLFAGAQSTLKKERAAPGRGGSGTITETFTATKTSAATTTVTAVPTGKPEVQVCVSAECVMLSASILQSLNTSVDPCEDFYEFSNGGWLASHQIPADRGEYGAFRELADNNKKIILKILEAIPSHGPDIAESAEEANLHKLKDVFTSCMDIDRLSEIGLQPLIPLVEYLLDTFGPFDLIPAPDVEIAEALPAWSNSWSDDYKIPEHLRIAGAKLEALRPGAATGRHIFNQRSERPSPLIVDDVMMSANDYERAAKMTQTLAWLNTRGEYLGVQALIDFTIEGDAGGEDSQVQGLCVYQASGGLPSKEYYEDAAILDLYQSVVQGILVDVASHTHASAALNKRDFIDTLAGWVDAEAAEKGWPWPWPGDDNDGKGDKKKPEDPKKSETLEERMGRLAGKIVQFERELIRAGANPEDLTNPHYSYNPYPTEKVDKALPFLDIPVYLATTAIRNYPSSIRITHPPYLKSVSRLVRETPDHVMSGYFATRLAMTYASALGPKTGVRSATRRLEEVLKGIKKGTEENRQDVCLSEVDNLIGFVAGREFIREAFSTEAKADGENIIRAIVKAFSDKLPHIAWMDQESATAAQKKANSLIPKVGYPLSPNTTDPNSLAAYYRAFDVKADDYFGNVYRNNIVQSARRWQLLGRKRDRQSWEMNPQTVNAYYSPSDGEIVFPAGILQPPFYSLEWPAHMKYGAFGAVAAHELTHAFDNMGSQYDDKGRLSDWWTPSTVEAFEERAQCIVRQYSKYFILDEDGNKVYLNGNLTNGENIGDSGIAQAFSAWKESVKSSNVAPLRLPGLDFSEDQLFFISMGRIWSQLIRPATAVSRVRTDPHSPDQWRVKGTLRNSAAFHEAFQCKEGSGMRPPKAEQCELW